MKRCEMYLNLNVLKEREEWMKSLGNLENTKKYKDFRGDTHENCGVNLENLKNVENAANS